MLKEIEIKNFCSFVDFDNYTSLFCKSPIAVFGMNGTGKTQFCLLLQYIGKMAKNEAFKQNTYSEELIEFLHKRISKDINQEKIFLKIDSFQISIDISKKEINVFGELPKFHVFNEKFVIENVGENVYFPVKDIKIGERNRVREDFQKKLQKIKKSILKVNEEIENRVNLERKASGYGKQNRTKWIISKENYLKNSNPFSGYSNAKNQLIKISTPPEKITSHIGRNFPPLSLPLEKEKIDYLFLTPFIKPELHQTVYKRFIEINREFYKKGVKLFKEMENICPLCLTKKRADDFVLGELIKFIESDYNNAKEDLFIILNYLKNFREEVIGFLKVSNEDNKYIREKIRKMNLYLSLSDIVIEEELFEKPISIIQKKIMDMENFKLDEVSSLVDAITEEFELLKQKYNQKIKIIQKVNEEIDRIKSHKRKLGEEIIKNCMHEFWKDYKLRHCLNELNKNKHDIEVKLKDLGKPNNNYQTIGFFNQIIKQFGIYKYELDEDSRLILKLEQDHDISEEGFRISSGEREYIAFSYFLAEVISSVNSIDELEDLSIIIDDPVDSSDLNKFFNFVSVIENLENIIRNIISNHEISTGQLIIFTHNALLFERLVNSKKFKPYNILLQGNQTIIRKVEEKEDLKPILTAIKKITDNIR